jgi:hypothetical protein
MARIAVRVAYVAVFLAVGVSYYYFLGPAPTPSERREAVGWWRPTGLAHESESAWLAPLQQIGRDAQQARHEGRSEPRGLIPLALFSLPVIALVALGFALFRAPLWRVGALALGLALCAFSYYGWLDPETWQDYSWRWPATLLSTTSFVALFALAPALVARVARRRSALLQGLALAAWFTSIYFLSTEVTGTNPRLEWNISPWPTLTLYGFQLVGLTLGTVYLAAGIGLLARGAPASRPRTLAAALLASALAAALVWLPFSQIGPLTIAVLALPAAVIAAAVGRDPATRGRPGAAYAVAGLLILAAIKLGQWQGEHFLATSRDEVAPRVIAAIERYRKDHDSYPDELPQLLPAYLPAIPLPRVGWFDTEDAAFIYTNLGDSFLLEFPGIVWMQCAYSPAYKEETREEAKPTAAAAPSGGGEHESLEASWSCESKPPQLW